MVGTETEVNPSMLKLLQVGGMENVGKRFGAAGSVPERLESHRSLLVRSFGQLSGFTNYCLSAMLGLAQGRDHLPANRTGFFGFSFHGENAPFLHGRLVEMGWDEVLRLLSGLDKLWFGVPEFYRLNETILLRVLLLGAEGTLGVLIIIDCLEPNLAEHG